MRPDVIPVPKEQYLKKASYSERANTRDVDKYLHVQLSVRCFLSEREDRRYWVFGYIYTVKKGLLSLLIEKIQ